MRVILFSLIAIVMTSFMTSCAQHESENIKSISIDPADCVIVLPQKADEGEIVAAKELKKHLDLIGGKDIPIVYGTTAATGKYRFYIGCYDRILKMAPGSGMWVVNPTKTYICGDDLSGDETLYAVYSLLEDKFGVRWIEPGDDGVVFRKREKFELETGCGGWYPELSLRILRTGSFSKASDTALKIFEKSKEEQDKEMADIRMWKKRMRMGNSSDINYGHAFTKWWKKYGMVHPEYFALNKYGIRGPEIDPKESFKDNPVWANVQHGETIKLCPSNPAVAQQVISDWLEKKPRPHCVNVCENDSPPMGFCRCDACRKLDGHNDDLNVYQVHLTDRYIYLVNEVLKLAKLYDKDATAVTYAYNETEFPPYKERVESGVILGMVPTTIDLQKLEAWYTGWEKMGANKMFLRPNYPCYYNTIGLPIGFEKHFYDVIQLSVKHRCVGMDLDSLMHQWDLSGMNDYIMAKTLSDPSQPFEKWEDEYCSAFGNSSAEVKDYFRYWRNEVWNKRLLPDLNDIVVKGKYHNFARGLMWNLSKYYKEEDFERTDAILNKALAKKLTDIEKKRLERLILSIRHARLVFKAITTKEPEKFKYSKELLAFRVKYKDTLRLDLLKLIENEDRAGDVTGIKTASQLEKFDLPWIQTPLPWYFKMDPENKGLSGNWEKKSFDEIKKEWELLPTNSFWESLPAHYPYPSAGLRKKLKNYDGIGWYSQLVTIPADWKNDEVYLFFGAVDESCQIYVNGKLAGEHPFVNPDDWCTPFSIRIDKQVAWDKTGQLVTVRVEDKNGSGGIYKRIWLVRVRH